MNEPTIDNIGEKLKHLERENRRLKYGDVVVLVGIAASIMMGQAKPSSVATGDFFDLNGAFML